MPCHYPITAWKDATGGIIFDERKGDAVQELRLPCGQCDGCRMERARQWAVRCTHEASLYAENCFITLTYNADHLPVYSNLVYDDFQRFLKRLRKQYSYHLPSKKHQGPWRKIRFFMCGEYGDLGRPHFHACLFNIDFDDRVYFKTTKSGAKVYTSKQLDSLWCDNNNNSIGFATVGNVNFDSAGYCARYIMKKQLGRHSDRHYEEIDYETGEVFLRTKEFNKMSLKPGIGHGFYRKWKSDIFPQDICVINGKATKPPKYYAKILDKEDEYCYSLVQESRWGKAQLHKADNTPERLEVKEKVLKARIALLKREL